MQMKRPQCEITISRLIHKREIPSSQLLFKRPTLTNDFEAGTESEKTNNSAAAKEQSTTITPQPFVILRAAKNLACVSLTLPCWPRFVIR